MRKIAGSRLVWLPAFFLFIACSAFGTNDEPAESSSDGGTSSSSGATSSSGSGSSSGSADAGLGESCGLPPYTTKLETLVPEGLTEESDPSGATSVLFTHVSNGLQVSITTAGTSAQHSLRHDVDRPSCLTIRERITLTNAPTAPGYKLVKVSFGASHNVYLAILASIVSASLQAVEQDTTLGNEGYRPLGDVPITTTTEHEITFEYRHGTPPMYALSLDGKPVPLAASQFAVDNPTAVLVGAPYVDPGGAGSYVLSELTIE